MGKTCWCSYDINRAASNGCLSCVQRLRALTQNWGRTCERAAEKGNLDIIEWARSKGCPWSSDTCGYAAKDGNLELLKWLWARRCPWSATTCFYAAKFGHFELLKWAREHGCELGADACAGAAENGHLAILQWLRTEGAEWDTRTVGAAVKNRHLDVLHWAVLHGCPVSEKDQTGLKFRGRMSLLLCFTASMRVYKPNTRNAGRTLRIMQELPDDIVRHIGSFL